MHDERVGPVSDEHKEFLGDILASARHLLQLINHVLDLSKVEAGKMGFRPEKLSLTRTIAGVCEILRTLAAGKRIQIDSSVDPSVDEVTLDPEKLKQVLYNYLTNALKFTPEEGRIKVSALPVGSDYFRILVEDSGIGIKPEDVSRLFVEFQQLDEGASKKYQGTGLGLALTKRIIEAQGGQVGVTSRPGAGSTFFVLLPRHAGAAREPDPGSPRHLVEGSDCSPRVLVIEDDLADRAHLPAGHALTGTAKP
jgi:signal transduction histidine kinase